MSGALKNIFIIGVFLAVCALTLWVGSNLGGLGYYLATTLILVYALALFFLRFERRVHLERELVMISIMCAIAVASRIAFIWIPHFKPMAAIIMIAGISFGARSGFLIGALSVLLSNFMFGQGPWTPWQMVAFGICGLIVGALADAGKLARCNLTKKQLVATAFMGAAIVLFISGPLLDVYALVSMIDLYSPESIITILLAGLPINAIQAAAVFLAILLLGNPLLNAICRAKVKYGLNTSDN